MIMLSVKGLVSILRHLARFVLIGTLLFQTACAGKTTIVRPELYQPRRIFRPIRVEIKLKREVLLRWQPLSGAIIIERKVRVSGIMSGCDNETIFIRATSPGLSEEYSVEVLIEDIEEMKMIGESGFERFFEGVAGMVDACCLYGWGAFIGWVR